MLSPGSHCGPTELSSLLRCSYSQALRDLFRHNRDDENLGTPLQLTSPPVKSPLSNSGFQNSHHECFSLLVTMREEGCWPGRAAAGDSHWALAQGHRPEQQKAFRGEVALPGRYRWHLAGGAPFAARGIKRPDSLFPKHAPGPCKKALGLTLFPLPQVRAWWTRKSHIWYKSNLVMPDPVLPDLPGQQLI